MRRSTSAAHALACALTAAAVGFAQGVPSQPANEKPASVAGEVRNAVDGLPVQRAHVTLRRFNNGGWDRYGALTGAEGKFAMANLPPGNYNVMMERVGFMDLNGQAATALVLKAGEKKDELRLKLTPTGTITGRVLDGEGKPVEYIQVRAEAGGRWERGGVTDDRGVYRIGGLRPGKYRVRADVQEIPVPPEIRTDRTVEVHYSATYHPNVLGERSATRVLVGAAVEVSGIDIHLVRTPILHVSGKVAGMPEDAPNVVVMLQPAGSMGRGGGGGLVKQDGAFEIWRPGPGKYTVRATCNNGGISLSSAPVEIEIGDSDVENLQLRLVAPEDIRGRVEYLDEDARNPPQPPGRQTSQRPPPPRRITMHNPDGGQSMPSAELTGDGAFTLLMVPPGKYRLLIGGAGVYVKSIQLGQTSMEGGSLDLRNGSGGAPLTVWVASATGTVGGTVSDEKGPVAGARVLLREDTTGLMNPAFSMTNQLGTYTFTGVAPGKYTILMVDDADLGGLGPGIPEDDDVTESIEVADHQTVNKDLKRRDPGRQ